MLTKKASVLNNKTPIQRGDSFRMSVSAPQQQQQQHTGSNGGVNFESLKRGGNNSGREDDLIFLKEPTDKSITDLLKSRFQQDHSIYTYMSSNLIAVNPFTTTATTVNMDNIENENEEKERRIQEHYHNTLTYSNVPHLYSIAEEAYRNMKKRGNGQLIMINGESGSGKTYSARVLIHYLTRVGVNGLLTENIRRTIVGANDVLQAFGNAKSVHNDNSSRFGSYVQLFYNFKGEISGAHFTSIQLDKYRVVKLRENERNFHIFYQLCEGADESVRRQVHLESSSKYKCLNPSQTSSAHNHDKEQFKVTENAMKEAGVTIHERIEIYKVLAAILHLGNLQFKVNNNNSNVEIVNVNVLTHAADCLSMDVAVLQNYLLLFNSTSSENNDHATADPLAMKRVMNHRDSFTVLLYDRLFEWLIFKLNTLVKPPESTSDGNCVSLLDFYGFENYHQNNSNGLEQLNINYLNERIQSMIIQQLLDEQQDYVNEDVPWKFKNIEHTSLQECIRVIHGLYDILESDSSYATDQNQLYSQIVEAFYEKSTSFEKSKNNSFQLQHYAAKVTYSNVVEWLTIRNHLMLYMNVTDAVLRKSTSSLINHKYNNHDNTMLGKNKRRILVDQQDDEMFDEFTRFKSDVDNILNSQLTDQQQHVKHILHVTCIKPNEHNKPNDFNEEYVMQQVNYLSLPSNLFIRKSGYQFRMSHVKFLERYRVCCERTWPRWNGIAKSGCMEILKELQVNPNLYALGKTCIFLRSPITISSLEDRVESCKSDMVKILERSYIRFMMRMNVLQRQQIACAIAQSTNMVMENKQKQHYTDFNGIVGDYQVIMVNQINSNGERDRRLLVVTRSHLLLLNHRSYTVLRRIALNQIVKLCCSSFSNDGFICIVNSTKSIDCLIEVPKFTNNSNNNNNSSSNNRRVNNATSAAPIHHSMIKYNENKYTVMALIRKQVLDSKRNTHLPVEIKEEFQIHLKKSRVNHLRFTKNNNNSSNSHEQPLIEEGPDCLLITVPKELDLYGGAKLRRQNSIYRKYYGDYMYLSQSEWFKQLQEQYNDKQISFSCVISKYNKVYKRQERILVITDRAIYNLKPNGYVIKRRIELFRLKSMCVSPLSDGFFLLRIPDEYDYLFESTKRSEIISILQTNYKNATRGELICDIQSTIVYRPDQMSVNNEQMIKFRRVHSSGGFDHNNSNARVVVSKSNSAQVLVRYDDEAEQEQGNRRMLTTMDIYQGQKLRRRDSLATSNTTTNSSDGSGHTETDHLNIASSDKWRKIREKHDESGKLLYSGVVNKVNQRYQVQGRIMVITETGIYNMDREASNVKRKIPIGHLSNISVSTMRDDFFILRVPDEYDYLFESTNKTQIIRILSEQFSKLTNGVKQLDVQVDDKHFYRAYKNSKGVRTIDFIDDLSVRQSLIQPTATGAIIRVNNSTSSSANMENTEATATTMNTTTTTTTPTTSSNAGVATTTTATNNNNSKNSKEKKMQQANASDVYGGMKQRRRNSLQREKLNKYNVDESAFKKLMAQNGDKEIVFAADVNKINQQLVSQKRLCLITDKNIYNLHPTDYKVKRRIQLDELDRVTVSPYADHIYCLHMPHSYDYLYASEKKSEIIEILSQLLLKYFNKKLNVVVKDKFDFSPNKGEFKSIHFLPVKRGDSSDDASDTYDMYGSCQLVTSIVETSSGIVVKSRYEENSVIDLESAYLYVNTLNNQPIDISNSCTTSGSSSNSSNVNSSTASVKHVKLKKRESYHLELRLFVNKHLEACSIHEKIDTMSSRQEFVTQVPDLKIQDRHVLKLPERKLLHSMLSKTNVTVDFKNPLGKTLLSVKFTYDVK